MKVLRLVLVFWYTIFLVSFVRIRLISNQTMLFCVRIAMEARILHVGIVLFAAIQFFSLFLREATESQLK